MPVFLLLLLFAAAQAEQDCQTPTNQPGKCVLINNCPHLFSRLFQNQTDKSKNVIKESYCGFEAIHFPKVCCPTAAIKYFQEGGAISHNQHAAKCGLHEPESPSDPWLALMEYEKSDGQRALLCTGVLINKKYVLTAAHCVKGKHIPSDAKLISVHFGKFGDSREPPVVLPIDGTTVHDSYDPENYNQYNDIALVRLKNKVNFKDDFVRPICIPTDSRKDFMGKTLTVTGYEKVEEGAKKRDGVATVWQSSECHLTYDRREVRLGESQICAGGRRLHYRHSHRFDLGGLLMHVAKDNSYTVVGILSVQPPCCENNNHPRVYTKVSSYIDWILNNLKP